MTIDEVYKFVKILANKENRGWIKPSEFNLLAKRAQLDVIKDRVGLPSPDGIVNGYKEDAKLFDELRTVITFEDNLITTNAGYTLPDDYLHFLSARFNDHEVDMVNPGDITRRRKSFLNPPSKEFPVGVMNSGHIPLYTSSGGIQESGNFKLTYIKEPTAPNWNFTTVNNVEVYNASNSTQLVLPESTHKEIAHRILSYLGVALREATIVEYGTATVLEQNK